MPPLLELRIRERRVEVLAHLDAPLPCVDAQPLRACRRKRHELGDGRAVARDDHFVTTLHVQEQS